MVADWSSSFVTVKGTSIKCHATSVHFRATLSTNQKLNRNRWLHVFASSSDWFTGLPASVASYYSGYGVTTLN